MLKKVYSPTPEERELVRRQGRELGIDFSIRGAGKKREVSLHTTPQQETEKKSDK